MMEASFIKKRRDAEYQSQSLLLEQELAKAKQEQKFMKMKIRLVKAEKQNPQHQMMFIPTKEYPLQKILMKQNKRKCRMRSGRECSRPSRNQSHLIWQLHQMLIQEGI